MKKKLLSWLLVVALVITMVPGQAFANSGGEVITITQQTINEDPHKGYGTVWENGHYLINGTVNYPEGTKQFADDVNIYNGRIKVSGDVVLELAEGAVLNVPSGISVTKGNVLTITGKGKLVAASKRYSYCAAIGGNGQSLKDGVSNSGTIIIDGPTIEATGSEKGAGIGSGNNGQAGKIEIKSGIVNATGGIQAAGIGGGAFGGIDGIDISGGTVNATGGNADYDAGGGAGIGCGYNKQEGNINITGGQITAIGGSCDTCPGYGIGDGGLNAEGKHCQVSITGKPEIIASSISDRTNVASWQGIISEDNGITTTCYSDNTLTKAMTIEKNQTLIINNGVTVTLASGVEIVNNGTIENNGSLIINGTLQNNGQIINRPTGKITNKGTFNNAGIIRNEGPSSSVDEPSGNGKMEKVTITFATGTQGIGKMDPVEMYVDKRNGTEYTLPDCKFTGQSSYGFTKWEINNKQYAPGDKVVVKDNITVTAMWRDLSKITITSTTNAWTDGQVMELQSDVTIEDRVVVTGNVVLDLGASHKLQVDRIIIDDDSMLTVKGSGTLKVIPSGRGNIGINVSNNSKFVVNGGNLIADSGVKTIQLCNNNSEFIMNGGTLTGTCGSSLYRDAVISGFNEKQGSVIINGGKVEVKFSDSSSIFGPIRVNKVLINGGELISDVRNETFDWNAIDCNEFRTTSNSTGFVRANSKGITDRSQEKNWKGIIVESKQIKVSGNQKLNQALTVNEGQTMTVLKNSSLDCNGYTLTNNGVIDLTQGGELNPSNPEGPGKILKVDGKLTEIKVTKQPDKVAYNYNDSFDPAGMVVKASFEGGMTVPITDWTVKNGDNLNISNKDVEISYTVGKVTKTATVPIIVRKSNGEMILRENMPQNWSQGGGIYRLPQGTSLIVNEDIKVSDRPVNIILDSKAHLKIGAVIAKEIEISGTGILETNGNNIYTEQGNITIDRATLDLTYNNGENSNALRAEKDLIIKNNAKVISKGTSGNIKAIKNLEIQNSTVNANTYIQGNNILISAGSNVTASKVTYYNGTTDNWNGFITNTSNKTTTVYGEQNLTENWTLDQDSTLAIAPNATLAIPKGVTLTATGATIDNKGTIDLTQNGTIVGWVPNGNVIIPHEFQETVAFNANGGTGSMENVIVDSRNTYALPDSTFTAPDNKHFIGWATKDKPSDTDTIYKSKDEYTFTENDKSAKTVTFYAQWADDTFTIQFDKNNADATGSMKNQNVNCATPEALLDNGYKLEGYTFGGWYENKECSGQEITVGPSGKKNGDNVILYAKWNPNEYTITFNEKGGTSVEDIRGIYKASVTLPSNITKEGYEFGGWYENNKCEGEASTLQQMPAKDMTLYAKWTPVEYTITYDLAGGKLEQGITNFGSYTIETPSFTLNNPIKDGYDFAGWILGNENEANKVVTIVNAYGDKKYTATWMPKQYKITFDVPEVETITKAYKENVQAPAVPTKLGYTFENWYEKENNQFKADPYEFSTMPLNGTKLYAKWNIAEYNISYDLAGGKLEPGSKNPESYTIQTPSFTLNNPTKEGYDFAGWILGNENEANKEVTIVNSYGNKKYTATWMPKQYKITFDVPEVETITKAYKENVQAPAVPTKLGYTFENWYEKENEQFKKEPYKFTTMPLNGTKLYAKWTVNKYTINFDENGGTGEAMASLSMVYDQEKKLTKNTYKKEGMVFNGWNTAKDGSGTAYDDEASVKNLTDTANGTVTLYAQWKKPYIPTPTPTPEPEVKPDVKPAPILPVEPPKEGADVGMTEQQQADTDKTIGDIIADIVKPEVKPEPPVDPEKPDPEQKPDPEKPQIPQTEAEKETAATEQKIAEAAKNGEQVKVNVETEKIVEDKAPVEVKKEIDQIKETMKDSFEAAGTKMLQLVNIDVTAQAVDKAGKTTDLGKLRNLGKSLTFTIQLPLDVTGNNYAVIRVHDGKAEIIASQYDPITKKITFDTDKFSTYAVVEYDKEIVKPEPPVEPEKPEVTKPGIVKNIDIDTDNGLFKVTFDKLDNATNYKVFVTEAGKDNWRWFKADKGSALVKQLYKKPIVKNGKYQIKVVAYNGDVKGEFSKIKTIYANRIGTKSAKMFAPQFSSITFAKTKAKVKTTTAKVVAKKVYKNAMPKNLQYKVSYRLKGTKTWNSKGYNAKNVKYVNGLKKGKVYTFAVRYRYTSAVDGKTNIYSNVIYKSARVK